MATTYRFTIKTDAVRSRGLLAVAGKLEVPRPSLKAAAEIADRFTAALRINVPDGSAATAWLECSSRLGLTIVRKYTGKPTKFNERGAAIAGVWTEERLGTTVEAGTQRARAS
jgi:hypothetical protein